MHEDQRVFTESDADRTMEFEKSIAYFYGAENPEMISSSYIKAIYELESLGLNAEEECLKVAMTPPLKEAYAEVQKQTQLKFNIDKAAHYELQLILSQAKKAPFEQIYTIMKNLYQEIFQTDSIQVHKSAMLRSFLYKYKVSLLNNEQKLSDNDYALMLFIAKASEQELKQLDSHQGISY